MDQEILRVEEFAKRVGYKTSTIRKKLFQREIRYHKVGRIVCIPVSEVARMLGRAIEPVSANGGDAK